MTRELIAIPSAAKTAALFPAAELVPALVSVRSSQSCSRHRSCPPVKMIRSALESRGEMQDLPPGARVTDTISRFRVARRRSPSSHVTLSWSKADSNSGSHPACDAPGSHKVHC